MIRCLLTILLALLPVTVAAQVKPPDVPDYVPVPATYAAGTDLNVLGDGSTPSGGVPPIVAQGKLPRRVLSPVNAMALVTTAAGVSFHDCPTMPAVGCEMKFRTAMAFNHENFDDPQIKYGQPGTFHCHDWAGNLIANAFSTYKSLREHSESTVGGYWLNGSAYVEPCMINTLTNTIVQIDNSVGNKAYYTEDSAFWGMLTAPPRGLRFDIGVDVLDPLDTRIDAEIAAANAQPGTAGRYSSGGNGVAGYACNDLTDNSLKPVTGRDDFLSRSVVNPDGSDPWAGQCKAGMLIYTQLNGPGCMDGTNLWSPTAFAHVRYTITDHLAGLPYPLNQVCPNHWYRMPHLVNEAFRRVGPGGFEDYRTWKLSSDAMASTNAHQTLPPGWSLHAGWMYGWDDDAFNMMLAFCLGIGGSQPHTCDYATIDATHRMLTNEPSPDNRFPNMVNTPYHGGVRDIPLGTGTVKGTMTGMHHGN